jgi:hypothetical protein
VLVELPLQDSCAAELAQVVGVPAKVEGRRAADAARKNVLWRDIIVSLIDLNRLMDAFEFERRYVLIYVLGFHFQVLIADLQNYDIVLRLQYKIGRYH